MPSHHQVKRRRSRLTTVVALVTAVSIAAASCGASVRESGGGDEERHEGPLELAVVPKAVGFDFWTQVRTGAQCAAKDHKDVNIQWDGVSKESDVTGQVDLLQNFITQDVDGLVYAATDAKVLSDVTKNAKGQGMTVVNIDSGTQPQPSDVPVYATDNEAAAEEAADLLAKSLGAGKQQVALLSFQPGTSTNDERIRGFRKGLNKHKNLSVADEQSTDSEYNKALTVTEDLLTANPNLSGIFAANEPSALGAAEAVREAGKAGEVKIVGWDAASDQLKALRDGTISALVVQNPFRMGYEAVNSTVAKLRKGTKPKSSDTGVTFVTKDNLDSPQVKKVLNPSCAKPPVE